MTYKQNLTILIVVATIIRIIVATTIGLGNDEVYYLTYAQHLQWNYFDHPPMVALLIRLTTLDLNFVNEFSVRLGAIVLSAVNTLLIFKIGKQIKDEKTGFIASLLFTGSFYSSIIAGVFILPDTPQLFFWLLSVYVLVLIVKQDVSNRNLLLVLFGITVGLCVMSKVHGVFLWLGFGLYIVFYEKKLFWNPYLYLAMMLTILIISPILIWNINNDFITYAFHSKRVVIDRGFNFSSFIREFLGGIFYNNPINYVLIIISLIGIFRKKASVLVAGKKLLLLLGLPLIVVLLFLSFFRETLPHWSGPGYVSLSLIAAVYVSEEHRLYKWVKYSCFFVLLIAIVGDLLINFYPGTIGKQTEENLGENDFSLDMYDWQFFKNEFQKKILSDHALGITNTRFVINNKWFPGSHIDNYIVQPLHLNFVAVGTLEDIHTYHWLNNHREKLKKGDDAYFITTSNTYTNPVDIYANTFHSIGKPFVIKQYRNKQPVRNLVVFLLKDFKG
jgi:hypothetical protein